MPFYLCHDQKKSQGGKKISCITNADERHNLIHVSTESKRMCVCACRKGGHNS